MKIPESWQSTLQAIVDADSPEKHARAVSDLFGHLADGAHESAGICESNWPGEKGVGAPWTKQGRALEDLQRRWRARTGV